MDNQLESVAKIITKLKQNNANIADACEIYLELLQNKELNQYLSKIKSSSDKVMIAV